MTREYLIAVTLLEMKTSQMQHPFANLAGACNPHASMMPPSLVQFQVDEWNGRVLLAGTGSEQMLDLHWPTERLQLKPYLTVLTSPSL